jgi:serine kinase of HPr protein (carbohydrate metabolism regulator)
MTTEPRSPPIVTTSHGSCVIFRGCGVLIHGASGAGKSTLAHQLMIEHQALLVADDRYISTCHGGRLIVSAPAKLHGLLEIRGIGIRRFPAEINTVIRLVVELTPPDQVPRLPEKDDQIIEIGGVNLPLIKTASAAQACLILQDWLHW